MSRTWPCESEPTPTMALTSHRQCKQRYSRQAERQRRQRNRLIPHGHIASALETRPHYFLQHLVQSQPSPKRCRSQASPAFCAAVSVTHTAGKSGTPGALGTFKLEPINENEKFSYRDNGKIDFFGDRAVARSNGAGEGDWTER